MVFGCLGVCGVLYGLILWFYWWGFAGVFWLTLSGFGFCLPCWLLVGLLAGVFIYGSWLLCDLLVWLLLLKCCLLTWL